MTENLILNSPYLKIWVNPKLRDQILSNDQDPRQELLKEILQNKVPIPQKPEGGH